MKKLQRQYEDDAESAAEEFKKLEQQLKAKYPQAKKLDGDKKAKAFSSAVGGGAEAVHGTQRPLAKAG